MKFSGVSSTSRRPGNRVYVRFSVSVASAVPVGRIRGDLMAAEAPVLQQGFGQEPNASTLLNHQHPRPLPEPIEGAPAPGEPQPPDRLLDHAWGAATQATHRSRHQP
jgi:hypothetical protein